MATNTKNISVRVDAAVADFIDEQAAGRKQDRSEFLRKLITEALADTRQSDQLEELAELREQVRRVRDDLAKLAVLVLTRHPAKEPLSFEQAKSIVTTTFSL
jgi:Arc/MetJ-type ribon-helix-helix transcriptional regulator